MSEPEMNSADFDDGLDEFGDAVHYDRERTGQIVRDTTPVDLSLEIPKMDFLGAAESRLKQGCLLASTQTPGIENLDAYREEHQLVLLTCNLPLQDVTPELRALRRTRPIEQQGNENGALRVSPVRFEKLIADDLMSISIGQTPGIGHIRMGLAMPYAMMAHGPMRALDTRLEAFYTTIVRDEHVCQALAATLAESMVHDAEELRKLLLARVPQVTTRHTNNVLLKYIEKEETNDSKNNLFKAWRRTENKRLVIEQITSGAGPIQASARIMADGGYHRLPTVRFDTFVPRAHSHDLLDPRRWAKVLLGEAILKLAASHPHVPAQSAKRIHEASVELRMSYTLPVRPEHFIRGQSYAETGGHVSHMTKDGSGLMQLLNNPSDPVFFVDAKPQEYDEPDPGGREQFGPNPNLTMEFGEAAPVKRKDPKPAARPKPKVYRDEEEPVQEPSGPDLFA